MALNSIELERSVDRPLSQPEVALLRSVARQLMNRRWVTLGDQRIPVRRTSRKYLKTVSFSMNGQEYIAVEQNAAKPSYWAQLARKGHQVVQFIESRTGHYIAVAVDGGVRAYSTPTNLKKSA